MEQKNKIIEILREYGDSLSNVNMYQSTLNRRLKFVNTRGAKKDSTKRAELSKKISNLNNSIKYDYLMTEAIENLEIRLNCLDKLHKKKVIRNKLEILGYKKKYLQNLSLEDLERISHPNNRKNRQEMCTILNKKEMWSKNTIDGWNTEQLKNAFKRDVQNKYSPLAESIPKRIKNNQRCNFTYTRRTKTREEYLNDISNILYFELTN